MATHERLFRTVRRAQPNLPIVMLSRPDVDGDPNADARRAVVRRTWENAKATGDEKVWFVDGATLFGKTDRDLCTVDGCHPNALGSLRMADAVEPFLREALASVQPSL